MASLLSCRKEYFIKNGYRNITRILTNRHCAADCLSCSYRPLFVNAQLLARNTHHLTSRCNATWAAHLSVKKRKKWMFLPRGPFFVLVVLCYINVMHNRPQGFCKRICKKIKVKFSCDLAIQCEVKVVNNVVAVRGSVHCTFRIKGGCIGCE